MQDFKPWQQCRWGPCSSGMWHRATNWCPTFRKSLMVSYSRPECPVNNRPLKMSPPRCLEKSDTTQWGGAISQKKEDHKRDHSIFHTRSVITVTTNTYIFDTITLPVSALQSHHQAYTITMKIKLYTFCKRNPLILYNYMYKTGEGRKVA
jgi:hypothetical protein